MFVLMPFEFPALKVHSVFVQPSDDEASSEISEEGNDTDYTVGVSGDCEYCLLPGWLAGWIAGWVSGGSVGIRGG